MTQLPDAQDGSLLVWNHEEHHIVNVTVEPDGTRTLEYPEALFVYRDGTAAGGSLEVAERAGGRWHCVGCRRVLHSNEIVCGCLIGDGQGPDDPF